jgi:Tfp pilus assembly protein PilF
VAFAFVNLPVRAPAETLRFRLASALHLPRIQASTATAHFNLGVTYAREAQDAPDPDALLALAEVELREALRQETRYAKVYVELGKVFARRGKTQDAIDQYRASLALEPGAWRTHHTLGLLYRRAGDGERAEASFRTAIALEPRESDSRVELGTLLLAEGRRDEARALFQEALARTPGDPAARRGMDASAGPSPERN